MTTEFEKRVVLVEDNPDFLRSLVAIFEESEDFTVAACYQTAESCLAECQTVGATPELFLVDLGLPGMSGQALITELNRLFPSIDVVAHTVFEDAQNVFQALKAGAVGYLLKGSTGKQLLANLRSLDTGGAPLTPKIARLLMSEFHQDAESPLSPRENEVLILLGEGHSYKSAAHELVVSVHTIHGHVKKLYEKLQVKNRREAVSKAKRKGWL